MQNQDVAASMLENGELPPNATLRDILARYDFGGDFSRRDIAAAVADFADGERGATFRADNPKLYAEIDFLFNEAVPLYGFRKVRAARNDPDKAAKDEKQTALEERARAVLHSPLWMFYDLEAPAAAGGGDRDGNALQAIANGVDFLVADRKKRIAGNKKRGKESQAKDNGDEERKRAAHDMDVALKRVHNDPDVRAGVHGALSAACRHVCEKFEPLTTQKNALGKYEEYAPLTGANGKPIKPETLADNYRRKYGTVRQRKADAPKNKRRTEAARAARHKK